MQRLITADKGDAGERVDLVLRRHLSDVPLATRTRVQTWIDQGRVSINSVIVTRVAARTAFGDAVAIVLPDDAVPRPPQAEAGTLDVLYEDEHVLAVNKPAGVVVHPTYGHKGGTLLNLLLGRAQHWPEGQRPSVVGRIDKGTSGLVLVAKTAGIHAALQRTLATRHSRKDYLALVWGTVSPSCGVIALRLRRDPLDRRRVVASPTEGLASRTEYVRMDAVALGRTSLSLLQCRLLTGRTHQIRAHCAASGWPIVGDDKYGESRWSLVDNPEVASGLRGFSRQALHAWGLRVVHPVTGGTLELVAPPADDLRAVIASTGLMSPAAPSLAPEAVWRV